MTEADIALARLPQADGLVKLRPVILLRQMPPFGDWLVCGVSSQLRHRVPAFDELIEPAHPDFLGSGLKAASLIRLGFVTVLPAAHLAGTIGALSSERHARLLQTLSAHLQPAAPP
jgi:mRNA interferase MazF